MTDTIGHRDYLVARTRSVLSTASPAAAARILGSKPTYELAVSHCIEVDVPTYEATGERTVINTTPPPPAVKAKVIVPQSRHREMTAGDLGKFIPECPKGRPVDVDAIIDACVEAWDVSRPAFMGPGRARRLAYPRFAACWIIRETLGWSFPMIGRAMGGKDHTTVLAAIRRGQEMYGTDVMWAMRYDLVRKTLFGAPK